MTDCGKYRVAGSKLEALTNELKLLSIHDLRSATAEQRAEFAAVCHTLAEVPEPSALGGTRELTKHESYWTHDDDAAESIGHLYYFAPTKRAQGPYTNQRRVEAIIDIAHDGTLAGVELIDNMPPPPKQD